jgi:hypothetical protein
MGRTTNVGAGAPRGGRGGGITAAARRGYLRATGSRAAGGLSAHVRNLQAAGRGAQARRHIQALERFGRGGGRAPGFVRGIVAR